ncbi:hypothetical protein HDU93_009260 [Gonapodya sp. JEL0774]|nr:hypothetical protein HDU93_009260 [Gonapodya sp. JEL0774]
MADKIHRRGPPTPADEAITAFLIPASPAATPVSSFTTVNSNLDLAASGSPKNISHPPTTHTAPKPPTLATDGKEPDDRHHVPKPAKVPKWHTYRAIFAHALRGAARSFVLAFLGRGALLSALKLLVALRKRPSSLLSAFQPFLSADALRTGAAFSGFSFVWKLMTNIAAKRNGRWSFWSGFSAGAVASLTLLLEHPTRRGVLVEQLGVRAMQAIAVKMHLGGHVRVWEGAALTFIFGCCQIMYAYIMRPSTIPPAYYQWMIKTGEFAYSESLALAVKPGSTMPRIILPARVPHELLDLNRRNIRLLDAPHSDVSLTTSLALSTIARFAGANVDQATRGFCEYVLPKALEALYYVLAAHDLAAPIPGWDIAAFAVSMGTIMFIFRRTVTNESMVSTDVGTQTLPSVETSSRSLNVIVVGAGAVGQVYAYHLLAAGCRVHMMVKEKYVDGMTKYPMRVMRSAISGKDSPILFHLTIRKCVNGAS